MSRDDGILIPGIEVQAHYRSPTPGTELLYCPVFGFELFLDTSPHGFHIPKAGGIRGKQAPDG